MLLVPYEMITLQREKEPVAVQDYERDLFKGKSNPFPIHL